MIILGIDPGTTRIGYGLIELKGSSAHCLSYGIIDNTGKDRSFSLQHTEEEISKLIEKYRPDAAAIEKLFFANNQKTAIQVSEFRGVLLLTLAKHGLSVSEFTPMEVKRFITGYGGAKKPQIQKMVQLLLKIAEPIEPDDAADALAIALCFSSSTV